MNVTMRRNEIIRLTSKHNYMSVIDLSQAFNVSEVTIRSDLRALEAAGKIVRNHGGAAMQAEPNMPVVTMNFSEGKLAMSEVKQRIARKAASFIHKGESVMLDSTSTTLCLSTQIAQMEQVTVISNSIPIFSELKEYKKGTLIGVPGTLNPVTQSFVGPLAEQMIGNLRANKAFLSPKSIFPDGMRDQILLEATLRKQMIDAVDEVFILADHSKFDTNSRLFMIDNFDAVHTVITDKSPPDNYLKLFENKEIRVVIADV